MNRDWPYILCPECGNNITDAKWRLRLLFSVAPIPCPHCAALVRMVGNRWIGYIVGMTSLLLGGHLWSRGYSLLIGALLFLFGTGAIAWGVFSSRLVPAESRPPQIKG